MRPRLNPLLRKLRKRALRRAELRVDASARGCRLGLGFLEPGTIGPDWRGLEEMPISVNLLGKAIVSGHLFDTFANVRVNNVKTTKKDWQQLVAKRPASRHPLVVAPSSMMVGTVESGAWNYLKQPVKELFVSHMHSQGYLRLAPIAAEMAFANQDANQESFFEFGHSCQSLPPMLFHCQVSRETSMVFHRKVPRETLDWSMRMALPLI